LGACKPVVQTLESKQEAQAVRESTQEVRVVQKLKASLEEALECKEVVPVRRSLPLAVVLGYKVVE
jgi:hypothetical protein